MLFKYCFFDGSSHLHYPICVEIKIMHRQITIKKVLWYMNLNRPSCFFRDSLIFCLTSQNFNIKFNSLPQICCISVAQRSCKVIFCFHIKLNKYPLKKQPYIKTSKSLTLSGESTRKFSNWLRSQSLSSSWCMDIWYFLKTRCDSLKLSTNSGRCRGLLLISLIYK